MLLGLNPSPANPRLHKLAYKRNLLTVTLKLIVTSIKLIVDLTLCLLQYLALVTYVAMMQGYVAMSYVAMWLCGYDL